MELAAPEMAIKWEAGRDWRWGRECGTSWVTTLRVSYLCWRHVKEIRTHPCHCLKFCLTCGLNSFGVQLGFERIGKISVSLFSLQAQEICIGPVACLSHNSLCGYTLFYLLAQKGSEAQHFPAVPAWPARVLFPEGVRDWMPVFKAVSLSAFVLHALGPP